MDELSNYSDESILTFLASGGKKELEKRGYKYGWYKEEQPNAGSIYVFFNPAFPDRVKIGYSDDFQRRMEQLSKNQSAPEPFHCYAIYKVKKRLTDKNLHKLITVLNPELQVYNEYFLIAPEAAYEVLSAIAQITGTENCLEKNPCNDPIFGTNVTKSPHSNDQTDEKKANFTFEMIGIPIGSKLQYKKNPSIVCITKDDKNHVDYKGNTYTLSGLVKELTGWTSAQGPSFFTYKGKILSDLRKERGV